VKSEKYLRSEERQEKKIGKIYYPARDLSSDTIPYYDSAYDIDMRKVIDVYAAATEHVDQGLSLTLFMRSELPEGMYEWKTETNKMTTRDLSILRNYAFKKGIKSIYYVRTYTSDNSEVGANDSLVHVDFMIGEATTNITGYTADGKEVAIFKDGNWA